MDWTKIRFSPEFEVHFSYEDYEEVKNMNSFGIRGWEQGYDDSITEEENHEEHPGAEFRPLKSNKLYYNEKSLKQIERLFKAIEYNGGHINEYCGMHIHIDMTDVPVKKLKQIIKNFYLNQKEIFKKYEPWNTRKEFCTPISEKFLHLKNAMDFYKNYYSEENRYEKYADIFIKKYWALNLGNLVSFKTFEFRFFNGTLDFEVFKSRIKWLLKFVANSINKGGRDEK